MTDLEYDVLDELYFVTAFEELQKTLSMDEASLQTVLKDLIGKGWVKVLEEGSVDLTPVEAQNISELKGLYFLATKAGLLVHNGRG